MSKVKSKTKRAWSFPFIAGLIVMAAICVGVWFLFFKDGGGVFNGGKYQFFYELDGKMVDVRADGYAKLKDKLLENPAREGYEFAGYFLDSTLSTPLTEENFNYKVAKLKAGDKIRISLKWYSTKNTEVQSFLLYEMLPDGVKITGTRDTSITDLVIPDMINGSPVIEIGKEAFYECNNLKNITLTSNIDFMSVHSFISVEKRKVTYLGSIESWCNVATNNEIKTGVDLSNHGRQGYGLFISDTEFYVDGEKIVDLVIPETVTHIGYCAFSNLIINNLILLAPKVYIYDYNFGSINKIYYKSYIRTFCAHNSDSPTFDTYYASDFAALAEAQNYKYSENEPTKTHDDLKDTFYYRVSNFGPELNRINTDIITGFWHFVDDKITIWNYFEDENFEYVSYSDDNASIIGVKNSNLTDCVIPKKVNGKNILYLENQVFLGSSIKTFDLGKIEYIGRCVFSKCANLESLTFSKSIKQIVHNAFSGYTNVYSNVKTEVYYEGTIFEWYNINFGNASSCPGPKFNLYVETNKLVELVDFSKQEFITSDNKIEGGGFDRCVSVKAVIVPVGVRWVGRAFKYGCKITKVFYLGTNETWKDEWISAGFTRYVTSETSTCKFVIESGTTLYYYSENEPTDAGNYWHYDTDGETPVVWGE